MKPAVVGGLVVALVVAAIAAYGAWSGSLARKDPAGARACAMLSDAIGDGQLGMNTSLAVGKVAKDSTTPAISAAVNVEALGSDKPFVVPSDFHAACVSAGVDMPAYVEPAR